MRIPLAVMPRQLINSATPFRPALSRYAIAALVLTITADDLFFDTPYGWSGLSAPLFIGMVAFAAALCNGTRLRWHSLRFAFLLVVSLVAMVETVDWRSSILAVTGLAGFALAASRRLPSGLGALPALGTFLAALPIAGLLELRDRLRVRQRTLRRGTRSAANARAWLVWIMPLILSLGFLTLLGAGNPIIEKGLAALYPSRLLTQVDPARVLFWILVCGLVWPFLRPRLLGRGTSTLSSQPDAVAARVRVSSLRLQSLCGPAAILRALLLFNVVFAVQTGLDATYLWGGMRLPPGVSYADYAHRGAYTLVAAALLAAAFVILAFRPDATASVDRRTRILVYLWIGQNVVLVVSAMLRLDLYVDVYALTQWRLAAFAWMGLVAAGLVLICLQIACRRSNRWLVAANLTVLGVVFAGSCFIDTNAMIARFNVKHSRELTGQGMPLDISHFGSLGPSAIPALDDYLDHLLAGEPRALPDGFARSRALQARNLRDRLARAYLARSGDWRNWSFRRWRLSQYLHADPTGASYGGSPLVRAP
ncbi:DUF4173 domain-containing protein [Aurantimonas sp. CSK15Z-1]|nr:DUF4173 domain-containing protein [Aurantimonas sp. CSK15Z-1]